MIRLTSPVDCSGLCQMGGGFLCCEIPPPSWPGELSISWDCRLKGLQFFTGNSEHTVVFEIRLVCPSSLQKILSRVQPCFPQVTLRLNMSPVNQIVLYLTFGT